MFRQDYIKRQVELFAQALANIVAKRKAGHYEEALTAIREARAELGIEVAFLSLDARSLVGLLGSDRISCLAALLEEEELIRTQIGDERGAARARELRQELAH